MAVSYKRLWKLLVDKEMSKCRFWGYCGVCAGCRNMGFV